MGADRSGLRSTHDGRISRKEGQGRLKTSRQRRWVRTEPIITIWEIMSAQPITIPTRKWCLRMKLCRPKDRTRQYVVLSQSSNTSLLQRVLVAFIILLENAAVPTRSWALRNFVT